jgi:hypothetical protein
MRRCTGTVGTALAACSNSQMNLRVGDRRIRFPRTGFLG